MKNKIIFIGGTAGTGKTTISRELAYRLKYAHRIGTGFIREISKSWVSKKTHPELFTYTFRPKSKKIINNFVKQSYTLKKPIDQILKRAQAEGTTIIIEGNHLLPKLYHKYELAFFILKTPGIKKHKKMLNGKTHAKRNITKKDFKNIIKIQEYLEKTANKHNLKIIKHDTIKKMTKNIIKKLNMLKNKT